MRERRAGEKSGRRKDEDEERWGISGRERGRERDRVWRTRGRKKVKKEQRERVRKMGYRGWKDSACVYKYRHCTGAKGYIFHSLFVVATATSVPGRVYAPATIVHSPTAICDRLASSESRWHRRLTSQTIPRHHEPCFETVDTRVPCPVIGNDETRSAGGVN